MGVLNPFSVTVWATPLLIGLAMGLYLRREMRPVGRVVMWVVYSAWAWGWISIWDSISSGGSGRFAVQQLIFDWGVKVTTLLGAGGLAGGEVVRRGDAAGGRRRNDVGPE